jgi:hypothetical protein
VNQWLWRHSRAGGSIHCTGIPARVNQLMTRLADARANRVREFN